jgi:hypothetical protein
VTGDLARLVALAGCIVLAGCDQYALVGVRETEVDDTGTPPAPQDAASPSDAAAPITPDAAPSSDASADAESDAAAECPPTEIAVCNPMVNDVCSAAVGQHCSVDVLNYLTGYCVFTSMPSPQLGGECLNTGVTESCSPTTLCHETLCRKICLCDADCDAGECCNEPIESTGFSVCTAC